MQTPKWAQDLILDAVLYIRSVSNLKPELPDIKWRHAHLRESSSGVCWPGHIVITQGKTRIDAKLVILHELAHWAFPCKVSSEGHTSRFWDLAWQLYREFKLPIRYCKWREGTYRKGALAAYRRNCKPH